MGEGEREGDRGGEGCGNGRAPTGAVHGITRMAGVRMEREGEMRAALCGMQT